jgi:hypothetical protein
MRLFDPTKGWCMDTKSVGTFGRWKRTEQQFFFPFACMLPYHHHHQADSIVFRIAGLIWQWPNHVFKFGHWLRWSSVSSLHKKGKTAQSAIVNWFPQRYGPTTIPSSRRRVSPRSFLLLLLGCWIARFPNESILFISRLHSFTWRSISGVGGCNTSPPGIMCGIWSKITSESVQIFVLSRQSKTGTVPLGFNSQNQSGFPLGPYRLISVSSYFTPEASRAIQTFWAIENHVF